MANATALEIPVWETRRAHPAVPSRSFGRRGNWQSAAINNLPEPAVGSPPARRATPVTRLPPTRRVEVRFRGTAEMEGRAVSTEHSAFDPMYPFRKHRKLGRFIASCQRDVPCSPRGNWQRFMPPAGVTLSANPSFLLSTNNHACLRIYHMAVPDFQTLMLPLLKLASDGQQHNLAEAIERLAQEFQLSDDDQAQLLRSGQTRLYNRVGWTTTYLKKAGLLQAVGPGRFELTDRGRDVLATRPVAIDVAFLES